MRNPHGPLRVGVGGPVGSGKTALMDALCKRLRDRYEIAAITNDIYTKWDAEYLVRTGALAPERIAGVETGGCPHTAIREDASINLAAVADMRKKFPALDLILIELGGDNLAATFSPELADLTIYVIDVAAGDKIPSKGGPGITRSDLLVINKVDLAPYVGASLEVMERDAKRMRGARPFVFSNLRTGQGLDDIERFIEQKGGLGAVSRVPLLSQCRSDHGLGRPPRLRGRVGRGAQIPAAPSLTLPRKREGTRRREWRERVPLSARAHQPDLAQQRLVRDAQQDRVGIRRDRMRVPARHRDDVADRERFRSCRPRLRCAPYRRSPSRDCSPWSCAARAWRRPAGASDAGRWSAARPWRSRPSWRRCRARAHRAPECGSPSGAARVTVSKPAGLDSKNIASACCTNGTSRKSIQ